MAYGLSVSKKKSLPLLIKSTCKLPKYPIRRSSDWNSTSIRYDMFGNDFICNPILISRLVTLIILKKLFVNHVINELSVDIFIINIISFIGSSTVQVINTNVSQHITNAIEQMHIEEYEMINKVIKYFMFYG
uniref:Uncharacterized protein n=1 Tax=Rhizophagus irregularis (strain DAOM 181602 / DAOM 197198 / MUCL 43194) TaxID=747089 RepID=U9UN19_RHIID